MDATSFPEALSSHMTLQPDSAFFHSIAGLSRSSQPAPLLSPHLLLGGELSDRETSGRAAVTVPADACGQRRIRSRTRKLPILPDRLMTYCVVAVAARPLVLSLSHRRKT